MDIILGENKLRLIMRDGEDTCSISGQTPLYYTLGVNVFSVVKKVGTEEGHHDSEF